MNLPESIVTENMDEIIRRSMLRLEQERIHVRELPEGSDQHTSAKAILKAGSASLGRLKAYRARFDLTR